MPTSRHSLTLYELNMLVRETLELSLNAEYWVEAELSEVRESRGHCYMELIQYDDSPSSVGSSAFGGLSLFSSAPPAAHNQPIARASAKCWKSVWQTAKPHFQRITGQQLHAGMKVMLRVYAQFHESYGFSWIVTDINPEYTMGDMQRKRQEIIAQLKQEGVFDLQRQLVLPLFAQRIAVISSATAAGYGDFSRQLHDNEHGFCFHTELFQATMQGEQTEQSIIAALDEINQRLDDFDVVVIIRGGGATADLSGFDTLLLAENVANFPLPIITGIGHDRDESILDMISHTRVKTPTAAAAFLIDHLKTVADAIDDYRQRLSRYTQQRLHTLKAQLAPIQESLPRLFANIRLRHEGRLDLLHARFVHHSQLRLSAATSSLSALSTRLPALAERRLLQEHHRLEIIEAKAKSLDPALLLRRGYSITTKDGKIVRNASQLKAGDIIETQFARGSIRSEVTEKRTKKQDNEKGNEI